MSKTKAFFTPPTPCTENLPVLRFLFETCRQICRNSSAAVDLGSPMTKRSTAYFGRWLGVQSKSSHELVHVVRPIPASHTCSLEEAREPCGFATRTSGSSLQVKRIVKGQDQILQTNSFLKHKDQWCVSADSASRVNTLQPFQIVVQTDDTAIF